MSSQPSVCASVAVMPRRVSLLNTPTLLAEDVRGHTRRGRSPENYSPDFQVCFPYLGLFVWEVGADRVVAHANQVLFVTGGETYVLEQPASTAYAELVITPDLPTLAELARVRDEHVASHRLFRRRSCRASFSLQRAVAECVQRSSAEDADPIAREEWILDLLRAALLHETPPAPPAASTHRLISRAKEYLEAHLSRSLLLADVAKAVGASPAYLTDVFRRVEGIPLHRYVIQLRLARALTELPHTNDLTRLALALGFSSHSHFTALFRCAFGITPSAFRERAAARRPPSTQP